MTDNLSKLAEQLAHLHIFRATEWPVIVGLDNCGICGLNIRDKVHLRSGETVETTILAALASERELGVAAGLEKAAQVVDDCNREGPYQAIAAAGRIRSLIPGTVLREQADSANLARGLAIEQAAQRVQHQAEAISLNGGSAVTGLGYGDLFELAGNIRSLASTDAAQALAAHDAAQRKLVNQEWCDAFQKVTKSEMHMATDVPSAFVPIIMRWIGEAMAKKFKREQSVHDAEIERRAQDKVIVRVLDILEGLTADDANATDPVFIAYQHIAKEFIAESQPAPAKEDSK